MLAEDISCVKAFYQTMRNSKCGLNLDGSNSYVLEYALKYANIVHYMCENNISILDKIRALTC